MRKKRNRRDKRKNFSNQSGLSGLREELARLEKVNLRLGGDLKLFCFGFFSSQKPSKRLKTQN